MSTQPFNPGGGPGDSSRSTLQTLDRRSREIFRRIVETYLATGEPVVSRNLSRALPMTLSPASVRNVMSDLEALGLIYAPHTSAGRLPTQSGLRLFIDGLLEIGEVSVEERSHIEARIAGNGRNRAVEEFLSEAGAMLSGLSGCAGVVLVDKGYDIQLINGAARRALEIHGTAVDRDFVHLASVVPSQPLRWQRRSPCPA